MSGVRGPNSALTDFLRSRGINAAQIQARHQRRVREAEAAAASSSAATPETTATTPTTAAEEIPSDEVPETTAPATRSRRSGRTTASTVTLTTAGPSTTSTASPSKAKKPPSKKRKKGPDCSDSSDIDDLTFNPYKKAAPIPGQISFCDECNCRFTVTPYSKPGKEEGSLLCTPCGKKVTAAAGKDKDGAVEGKKKTTGVKRQRKKQNMKSLLDGETLGAKSLRELAINVVAKHIDEVGQVMDCLQLGRRDVDRICQIISRSRALNDHTLKLFLDPGITRLNLYDCSKVSTNQLRTIGAILPTLKYLMLRFCGSVTDEVLTYYSTQLTQLKGIEIGGAFLVTKECYVEFFKKRGAGLEEVTITDTFRVNAEVISSLVDNCPNLKELRLKQIVRLDNECVRLLTGLTDLRVLEISDPGEEVEDSAVIDVLNSIGSGLRELNLKGCSLLTDQVVLAIRQCCPRLQVLSLSEMEEVTDEAIAQLFRNWDINPGLQSLDLSRIRKLNNFGISAMLDHSCETLEELNLNSCQLPQESWVFWSEGGRKMPRLVSLDVGFVRSVDDEIVEKLCAEVCLNLVELKVWGDHHITEAINLPNRVRIIGREADLH